MRTCIVLIALFLMPFVRADIDLHTLAEKIRLFSTQIGDPKVATALKADADRLEMPSGNPREQIRTIESILQKLDNYKKKEGALTLRRGCIRAETYFQEIPYELLRQKVREYLLEQYPDAEIEFSYKEEGKRLGDCAHVSLSGRPEVTYHAKTHGRGLYSSVESESSYYEAEPVDLRELFVYKFLQYSGFGPEVHFTWYDERNFYIITKDVGCTESGEVKKYDYGTVKSRQDLLGISLGAKYTKLKPSQEPLVNRVIKESFVLIDIISRIFELEDVITNYGNFFFVTDVSGSISSFSVIDFEISNRRTTFAETLFRGFLLGTGPYHCLGFSDPISRYFMVDRDESARIETAQEIFLPLVETFTRAIEQSFQNILALQKEIPTLDIEPLKEYHQEIQDNMDALVKNLQTP
ncbi:MAG: hypothetical protein LBH52_01745 [Puniceicoccales bacterium]|nr:hypothetical protein [Puniceicoccales bacterium]